MTAHSFAPVETQTTVFLCADGSTHLQRLPALEANLKHHYSTEANFLDIPFSELVEWLHENGDFVDTILRNPELGETQKPK